MTSVVFEKKVAGPATHAIVIGVGSYLHLPGGKGKKFKEHGGLGQLKSPPVSARAIARWLIEDYKHPKKPLASVSLLLSDPTSQAFEFQVGKKLKQVMVPRATMAECEQAVLEWRDRGDRKPEHLLLFFFCGHGLAASIELSLLLEDFGRPDGHLNGAIDFRRLRQNMVECQAREQCYFVDACRIGSAMLIKNDGFAGQPIIHAKDTFNTSGLLRQAPTFHSTLVGAPAYARTGQASLFTSALLDGLNGAGCSDELGPWQVHTTSLNHALGMLMRDASNRHALPIAQIPTDDGMTLVELNVVPDPQVPVTVTCLPQAANSKAHLVCTGGAKPQKRKPAKEPWRLRLPVGDYAFSAEFKTPGFNPAQEPKVSVRPAFKQVQLKVGP